MTIRKKRDGVECSEPFKRSSDRSGGAVEAPRGIAVEALFVRRAAGGKRGLEEPACAVIVCRILGG